MTPRDTNNVDTMPVETMCLSEERTALLRNAGIRTLGDARAALRAPEGPPDLGTLEVDIDWRLVARILRFYDRESAEAERRDAGLRPPPESVRRGETGAKR